MNNKKIYFFVKDISKESKVHRIGSWSDSSFRTFLGYVRMMFKDNYMHADGTDQCGHCRDGPECILYVESNMVGGFRIVEVRLSDQSEWDRLQRLASISGSRSLNVSYVRFRCPYVVDW